MSNPVIPFLFNRLNYIGFLESDRLTAISDSITNLINRL